MDLGSSDVSTGKKLKAVSREEEEEEEEEGFFDEDDCCFSDDYTNFSDNEDEEEEYIDDECAFLQSKFDKADLPAGVEVSLTSFIDPDSKKATLLQGNKKIDNLTELIQFQRFDIVDSFSDHYFLQSGEEISQPQLQGDKNWAKRIQKEWQSLSTDLPESIYVRVSEERMDILRASIVGAAGTPYHDGLFIFDCHFPPTYPHTPPLVHYHSGGLRINPNLYACGKVCLSLLGMWSGKNSENWIPKTSTMLQVLVSIQALILNQEPFFNEPGYESRFTSLVGKKKSNDYSENVLILSLKTMVYTLRNPPQHFNELVESHFRRRGHNILSACRAYKDGAMVASDIKKFKKFDQNGENGSEEFRSAVNGNINLLVACFLKNGTPNCDKFCVDPNIAAHSQPIDQTNIKKS